MRRKVKLAAFIVSLVTTILVGIFTIPFLCVPLLWMVPMTIIIYIAYEHEKRLSPGFIFWVSFLMFNPTIPILLLYSENKFTRRRWAYYCAIFAVICSAIFVIPLAWMIPFTVKLNKTTSAEWEPTIAFKICYLIFFGPVPLTAGLVSGILLLTEPKREDF